MTQDASRWKAIAAAVLLLASAGAGVAAFAQDGPGDDRAPETASSATGPAGDGEAPSTQDEETAVDASASSLSPDDFDDRVLERFSGDRARAPATGNLELRVDRGPVRVVGWDDPGYEVLVLQENASDGPAVHDHETSVDWSDDSSGDTLDLKLDVTRDGTYGAGVQTDAGSTEDPHRDRAVVAFVPAGTDYQEVVACSGREGAFEHAWEDSWGSIPWPWGDRRDVEEDDCLASEDSPGFHLHADLRLEDDGKEKAFPEVRTGITGIDGESVRVSSAYGAVDATDLDVGAFTALSGYGDVHAEGVTAGNASLLSGHGDVVAPGTSGEDVQAVTEHGDVAVGFTPEASGTLLLWSGHGKAELQVVPPDPVAYDVSAGTDHGTIDVSVQDLTVEVRDRDDNESWQEPSYWLSLFEDDGYEKTADGRSPSWSSTATRTEVRAFTDSGDVLVTDGLQTSVDFTMDDGEDEDERQR